MLNIIQATSVKSSLEYFVRASALQWTEVIKRPMLAEDRIGDE